MITLYILLSISVILNIYFYYTKNKNISTLKDKEEDLNNREKVIDSVTTNFKNRVSRFNDIVNGNLKQGYYVHGLRYGSVDTGYESYDVDVFVSEIDRYTNGKSKIKFDYINVGKPPKDKNWKLDNTEKFIKNHFSELVDTKDIEWLESVNELQKAREKKLKRIIDEGL